MSSPVVIRGKKSSKNIKASFMKALEEAAERGTSHHVFLNDIPAHPNPPNFIEETMPQLLAHQAHSTHVKTKLLGVPKFGLEGVPLPGIEEDAALHEAPSKVQQNGLFLVMNDGDNEETLRTMISEKDATVRYIVNRPRPGSASEAGPVSIRQVVGDTKESPTKNLLSLNDEDSQQHQPEKKERIISSHATKRISKDIILDDSPNLSRVPTRADHRDHKYSEDKHLETSASIVEAIAALETKHDHSQRDSDTFPSNGLEVSPKKYEGAPRPQHSLEPKKAVKVKPKSFTYVSKTSLEKLDSNQLAKVASKEGKPVPIASSQSSTNHASGSLGLYIVPSPAPAPARIDSAQFLVSVADSKTEKSLILSIPSLHESDRKSSQNALLIQEFMTTGRAEDAGPVHQPAAVVPAQKFVLRKEKPQTVAKIVVPRPVSKPPTRETVTATTHNAHARASSPETKPTKKTNDSPAKLPIHPTHTETEEVVGSEEAKKESLNDEIDELQRSPVQDKTPPKVKTTKAGSLKRLLSDLKPSEDPEPEAQVAPTVTTAPLRSINIDLEDKKALIKKRDAMQVTAQLRKMGVQATATAPAEGTEIRGYFDRHAEPVFVDHKASQLAKTQALQFRNTPQSQWPDDHSLEDEDDRSLVDIVPVMPMEQVPHPALLRANSNTSLNSKGSDSSKVAANVVRFLDELSDADKELLDNLDENMRARLMAQLKKGKDPRLMRQITQKIFVEARLSEMLQMDMLIDVLDVKDRYFRVNVASDYGGSLFVILLKLDTQDADKLTPEKFKLERSLMDLPGYQEHRKVKVDRTSAVQVQFDALRPCTSYFVYVAVDRSAAEEIAKREGISVDELKDTSPPIFKDIMTADETLDIEWSRLTTSMRVTELRAAIRSEFVQIKARFHFPEVPLPSDDMLVSEALVKLLDPTTSEAAQTEMRAVVPREALDFVDWWKGDGVCGSRERGEFQLLEALHAVVKGVMVRVFVNEGFASGEDVDVLTKYALHALKDYDKYKCHRKAEPEMPHPLLMERFSDEERDEGALLLRKFRSWFKGGIVVEDYEEVQRQKTELLAASGPPGLRMEDSISVSEGSVDSFDSQLKTQMPDVPLTMQRLLDRENALLMLIEASDACTTLVDDLVKCYRVVVDKQFTEIMMVNDRGRITEKDCVHIMGAKKLLQLCVDNMLYEESQLNFSELLPFPALVFEQIDPFMYIDLHAINMTIVTRDAANDLVAFPFFVYLQRMAAVDLFTQTSLESLKPDNPPPMNVKTLPGTTRKPIKAWQSMTKADQETEMVLACSLDAIWEVALEDGIEMPEPEDRSLLLDHFPFKARAWRLFRAWYAGEEEIVPVPGQGVPTLARVLFSELYESRQVDQDPFVVESMKKQNLPLPVQAREGELDIEMLAATFGANKRNSQVRPGSRAAATTSAAVSSGPPSAAANRRQRPTRQQSALRRSVFLEENLDTMKQAYEQSMNTNAGGIVRAEMIAMTLAKVFQSRRLQTLKWLWPPGLNRTGLQYLMPRVSFLMPRFSLPEKRFRLFPRRIKDAFTLREIDSWYTPFELDQDDLLMKRAEEKGVKLRAYHEWLALEPQRIAQSRLDMIEEDDLAWQRRASDALIEETFRAFEQRFEQLDEDVDNGDFDFRAQIDLQALQASNKPFVVGENEEESEEAIPAKRRSRGGKRLSKIEASFLAKKFFRFEGPLPKEYWYIFEESVEFQHGSGIYNDDEAEEILEQQRATAQKALEAAYSLERYLNEEKKKRDEEEKQRQKREEQDRRLREGVMRRRQIREHLEDLKRQRIIRAAEEKQRREAQELAERQERERIEQEQERIAYLQRVEEERQAELQLMYQEEMYTRDYKVQVRELRLMEHEDILSFLHEQIVVRREEYRQQRIDELKEIYEPFVPFQFKKDQIRLPALHDILKTKEEKMQEVDFLQEIMDSMSLAPSHTSSAHPHLSHGSHAYFASNTLQEHDTESSMRHRSKRFTTLFGDVRFHPELLHEDPERIRLQQEEEARIARLIAEGDFEDYEDYEDEDDDLAQDTPAVALDAPHHPASDVPSHEFVHTGAVLEDDLQSTHSADLKSVGSNKSLTSTSTGRSLRRRKRAALANKPHIMSPRTGNNLFQRSIDSFPTKRRIHKAAAELQQAKERDKDPQDNESTGSQQLLAMNPYEGHWSMLKRPTPVLYASAPMMVQPTFYGTGLEALATPSSSDAKPASAQSKHRANRLLRPLKQQLKKDLQLIHSATTSLLPPPSHPTSSLPVDPLQQQRQTSLPQLHFLEDTNSLDAHQIMEAYFPPDGGVTDETSLQQESVAQSQESSIFHASIHDQEPHQHRGRKKMKELLSLSSQTLGRGDAKDWGKLMRSQRAMAIASLTAMEGGKYHLAERQRLIDIASHANKHTITSKEPTEKRDSRALLDASEKDLMDVKTAKLAQSASAAVSKLKEQRERVKEYVNSEAYAKDKFFLKACEPGLHEADAIALSPVALKFQREIMEKVAQDEAMEYRGNATMQSEDRALSPTAKSPLNARSSSRLGLNAHSEHQQPTVSTVTHSLETSSSQMQPNNHASSIKQAKDLAKKKKEDHRPKSAVKAVPAPGPKAVGALFGSSLTMQHKNKLAGLSGNSQEAIPDLNVRKTSKAAPTRSSVDSSSRKSQSLVEQPPSRDHSLTLDDNASSTSFAQSMSIKPLRVPSPNPALKTPRANSPDARPRSVRSLDLFIHTPQSSTRKMTDEIELEVKNTLHFLDGAAAAGVE